MISHMLLKKQPLGLGDNLYLYYLLKCNTYVIEENIANGVFSLITYTETVRDIINNAQSLKIPYSEWDLLIFLYSTKK